MNENEVVLYAGIRQILNIVFSDKPIPPSFNSPETISYTFATTSFLFYALDTLKSGPSEYVTTQIFNFINPNSVPQPETSLIITKIIEKLGVFLDFLRINREHPCASQFLTGENWNANLLQIIRQ